MAEDGARTGRKKPLFLKFRSGKSFIITVVAMAVFTDIFLYGLVVPVFPFALQERANVPAETVRISVLLAVYGAGLFVGSPMCGYIAGKSPSRQAPFMAGLATLAGSTVMLCVGSSIPVLVVGRLFQGISAAIVWTVGLALLVDTVGRDEVGEAMGIVAMSMSLGIFLAPLLGGVVYENGGYFAVFAMAFSFIGVDIILRIIVIEKKTAKLYADPEEVVSGDPVSNGQSLDPAQATPAASQRWTEKLPPIVTLLCYPRLLSALWGTLMQAVLSTSFETTVPMYIKDNFGFGPTGAGLVFLPIIIPSFLGPLVGKMSDRYGPRLVATAGFIFLVPFLIMLRLPGKHTLNQVVFFCALLALCGTGLAGVMPPVMAEITNVVRDLEAKKPGRFGKNGAFAQAYSLCNIAFAGGSLVGPLLAGFLKENVGWNAVTLVLGKLPLLPKLSSAG
ncbi:major facilitator superfamily domain-containing protein [Sphaerosporella brunnea]|uniref:Major facilitator superfamily domain-containing protein n=1 Tax=Sphaerosporella brunnea TaxID=1250544 RepID=A0A5J5EW31_9PEZI|nr:major facilitator superfamily domain-containing protein [Sphaerosporella brunnea]